MIRASTVIALLISLIFACIPAPALALGKSKVPFKLVDNNVILVPLKINDTTTSTFIFDTGGGINVLSEKLAEKLNFKSTGSYTGKRMSGQALTMSTGKIKSLSFGSLTKKNVAVAKWDLKSFLPNNETYKNVEGVLSLNFFRDTPFTLDYKNKTIAIESNKTLKQIAASGKSSPIKVVTKKGVDTAIFLPVSITTNNDALVEVDTGSNHFILDTNYMKKLGILAKDKSVVKRIGKDQTGHAYTRYYKNIPGHIWVSSSPSVKQPKPKVMFQKIIYDGLVGKDFLKDFITTFDLKNKRMIFQ